MTRSPVLIPNPPRTPSLWLLAIASCLLANAIGVVPSNGQGLFRSSMEIPSAEFLPPPRNVRQLIRDAKEAIAKEQYSDAVVRLGDLLRGVTAQTNPEASQDYFLKPSDLKGKDTDAEKDPNQPQPNRRKTPLAPTTSVMRQVRDLIGSLPEQAMETYDLRYGPLAGKLLDEAGPRRDWDTVEQVRREFFHTQAGYEASVLLALREWHLGNALATSMILDDLVVQPRAIKQVGDGIVVLHAVACDVSGRAIPKPVVWPSRFTVSLSKSGSESDEAETPEKWRNWIQSQSGSDQIRSVPLAEEYPILGGRLNRNGLDAGQMPLSNPRWMLESSASPRQERLIEGETQQLKASGQLPPPSWMPLRIGDQLLMRTTQRVLGVDYRTGKRVWQYPWFSPPETVPMSEDANGRMESEEDPTEILSQRVWNDVPYGQLSSDGKRVFMLDDLSKVEVERFGPFGMRGMSSSEAGKNTLVALDLATEGKLLWRLGSVETEPSAFSEVFFLGPPLPVRGRLYVLAEIAGEIVLVCLRPEDGSEDWRQVLVSVESGGITTDPVRRVAGAMPTYHEGLLICPTGAGATIAVDLIDRTLRWVNQHPRSQEFVRNVFRPNPDVSMNQLSQRWSGSVAIAEGNDIVLTPVESDRLIVVDALTGQNRFAPQNRMRQLYVAGIRNEQFFTVAGNRIWAGDIHTGKIIWSTPSDLVHPGQRVAGRGVFGKSSYFLPTTNNELIEVSLKDGSVLDRRLLRYPLGNLLAVDGEIISQATTTLAVAYGEASLQPRVDAVLAKDPTDFTAMVRKAELLIEKGDRLAAMDLLGKARELDPRNDEVILLSIEAMLGSLREDPTASRVNLESLQQLIDRPEQQVELLVLRIRGLLENDFEKANAKSKTSVPPANLKLTFELLQQLSNLLIEQPLVTQSQTSIFSDASRDFTLNSWIAARVAQTMALADEATQKEIKEQFAHYLGANQRLDRGSLQKTLQHFAPLGSATQQLRRELLRRELQSEDYFATERLAWADVLTADANIEQLDTSSLLALASAYRQTNWDENLRWLGQVLSQRISDEEPRSDVNENLTEIKELIVAAEESGNRWQQPDQWPEHVSLQWQGSNLRTTRGLTSERRYAGTTRLMGKQMIGWQAISDNNPLALVNPYGISRPVAIEGLTSRSSADKELTFSGGLMLVLTPSELLGIDLFRVLSGSVENPVRWRRSLGSDGQPVAKRRSATTKFGDQIYRYLMNSSNASDPDAQMRLGPVMGDRLFLLMGKDLVCHDALTGQQRWRTTIDIAGDAVVANQSHVAVVSSKHDRVMLFDIHDGQLHDGHAARIGTIVANFGGHILIESPVSEVLASPFNIGDDDLAEEIAKVSADPTQYSPQLVEILDPITRGRLQYRIASPANRTEEERTSACGQLVDGRTFALLDSNGRATVWDVLTGSEIADVTVPVQAGLFGLAALPIQDQLLLLPASRTPLRDVGETTSVTVSGGAQVRPLTAIHAISTVDGSVNWSREFDKPWGCTTRQPWLTPMPLLVRRYSYYASTASRRWELDVTGIDAKTGKTRHEIKGKNVSSRNNLIETQVKLLAPRDQMVASIHLENLIYDFTDEPKPVADPEEKSSAPTDEKKSGRE